MQAHVSHVWHFALPRPPGAPALPHARLGRSQAALESVKSARRGAARAGGAQSTRVCDQRYIWLAGQTQQATERVYYYGLP